MIFSHPRIVLGNWCPAVGFNAAFDLGQGMVFALYCGIRNRDGGDEPTGVVVLGVAKNGRSRADFDDFAAPHNGDPVADAFNGSDIVADE